jgi:CRISPR-associated endonuclease/helicase Cas3
MIKTFTQLSKNIDFNLINSKTYLSKHFIKSKNNFEYLEDHLDKCFNFFLKLINKRNLESIYDNLLITIFDNDHFKINESKETILLFIYYHDIGKINYNFQNEVINLFSRKQIKVDLEKIIPPQGNNYLSKNKDHSIYSSAILLTVIYDNLFKSIGFNKNYYDLYFLIYVLSSIVTRHHTFLDNINNKCVGDNLEGDIKNLFDLIKTDTIYKYIYNQINTKYNYDFDSFYGYLENLFENIYYDFYKKILKRKGVDIYFLIKLTYSNLVLSDFYSSYKYSCEKGEIKIESINLKLKNLLNNNFKKYKKYNNLENYNFCSLNNCSSLNEVRSNLLYLSNKNIKKKIKNNKIFMLTVPTGGGKTNISINMALEILNFKKDINKIFWCFPFINIVEQNYEVIQNTLSNKNSTMSNLVSSIYSSDISTISENINSNTDIEKDDHLYDLLLNESFLNNKINVTTFVNFFNSFIKVKKNNRYKIAHICNSVVILDEIQSLPENKLDFFYNLIKWISDKYNVYFIIMSATLPNLNYFFKSNVNIPQLIENHQIYFNNRFFKRNKVIFKLEVNNLKQVLNLLYDEINSNKNLNKILLTFNTISTSLEIYKSIFNKLNYEVFLLNSNTPNVERKKIINHIKNSNHKIILVSTQSIEAGVDLDFDFAIRDYATIDSIEQIAGRVNRESNRGKINSKIFVVKYKSSTKKKFDYEYVYNNSIKMELQIKQQKLNSNFEENIINNKKFDKFYKSIAEYLNFKNKQNSNFNYNLNNLKQLLFRDINNDLFIIDNKNYVFFYVPFSYNKKDIKQVYPNVLDVLDHYSKKYKIKFWRKNSLSFTSIIKALDRSILKKDKIAIKLFQFILDFYKFSLISNNKDIFRLKSFINKYKTNLSNYIDNIVNNTFFDSFFIEKYNIKSNIKQRIFNVHFFKEKLKDYDPQEAVFI